MMFSGVAKPEMITGSSEAGSGADQFREEMSGSRLHMGLVKSI